VEGVVLQIFELAVQQDRTQVEVDMFGVLEVADIHILLVEEYSICLVAWVLHIQLVVAVAHRPLADLEP
jgi:hypothetical protein